MPYFLDKLKNTPDGDGNLLDHSLVLYGSPMGDSNVHNHKRVPMFLAGHANGKLKGNCTCGAQDATPMANVLLTMLHKLGVNVERSATAPARSRSNREASMHVSKAYIVRILLAACCFRPPATRGLPMRRCRATRRGAFAAEAERRRERRPGRRHDGAALGGVSTTIWKWPRCCSRRART